MRRHPSLHGLSTDHHHGLVLALRAERAAQDDDKDAQDVMWRQVQERFVSELEPHFEIEETLLLPAMQEAGETALVERTLAEHAQLRDLVKDGSSTRLAEFAVRLRAHIRFEERVLFPAAEESLDADALAAVAAGSQSEG